MQFQSTPAIAGGRISTATRGRYACRRFNPRPPLLAGESRDAWPPSRCSAVSIHARHCWRANPDEALDALIEKLVSIHARHCWRANPRYPRPRCKSARFQSTPAIAGGRIWRSSAASAPVPSFNPRPPLLAGESTTWANTAAATWFQSTPAIAGGRITAAPCPCAAPVLVSIHARHCWRANHPHAPGRRIASLFQSTPAIAGGRIKIQQRNQARQNRFNPRPPLLAGESRQRAALGFANLEVSIHARHCWRANRCSSPVHRH